MKPPYANEVASLPATYEAARTAPMQGLEASLQAMGAGPAVYVGSGGSMVLASLASRLHELCYRQPANRLTALELIQLPHLTRRGALLFSSSAKHPDAQLVLNDFARGKFSPAVLWTHRTAADLTSLAGPATIIQSLPPLAHPDGFLATNSILQAAVLLMRAFLGDTAIPSQLAAVSETDTAVGDEVLVLTPPSLVPVATDVEVRLVESGLAAVHVTDYRNFAHGRHTGFARRLQRTTVIALSDASSRELADATVRELPGTADIRRWSTNEPWPQSVLGLLVRSMKLAHTTGRNAGLDVARPSVPDFGRRLYHLPVTKKVSALAASGVERKAAAMHLEGGGAELEEVREAGRRWVKELSSQSIKALAMDYDGTVCWTSRRFDLPTEDIQTELVRLMSGGLCVGFASGRGRSLHDDLRKWVPQHLWSRVIVGLYNGAVINTLDEDVAPWSQSTAWSKSVTDALGRDESFARFRVQERAVQVSLEAASSKVGVGSLVHPVRALLRQAGVQATVVTSGHSVDIVAPMTSKVNVVNRLNSVVDGATLIIGDQGQLGGNDYEMLSVSPWSLTVDKTSGNLSSCWFAGRGDRFGPALLHHYLTALRPARSGHSLKGLRVE